VHTVPYPGALECLDALDQLGVKTAVVTNKFEEFACSILGQLSLEQRFVTIIGGNSLGKGEDGKFIAKPAPDPILAAKEACGGGNFAFIGDSSYDVNAAKAASVPVVVAAYGYCDKAPQDLGGNAVIESLDQFIPALRAL
jgi:phosphoglycolate phosphatase